MRIEICELLSHSETNAAGAKHGIRGKLYLLLQGSEHTYALKCVIGRSKF